MHYAGTRKDSRAATNPLRSLPLYRPASAILRPTVTDHMIGALRRALHSVPGYAKAYDAARAALGRANRHNVAWRRESQRDAMRALNTARAAMRANLRAVAKLEAELLALAGPADAWAQAAALAGRGAV